MEERRRRGLRIDAAGGVPGGPVAACPGTEHIRNTPSSGQTARGGWAGAGGIPSQQSRDAPPGRIALLGSAVSWPIEGERCMEKPRGAHAHRANVSGFPKSRGPTTRKPIPRKPAVFRQWPPANVSVDVSADVSGHIKNGRGHIGGHIADTSADTFSRIGRWGLQPLAHPPRAPLFW